MSPLGTPAGAADTACPAPPSRRLSETNSLVPITTTKSHRTLSLHPTRSCYDGHSYHRDQEADADNGSPPEVDGQGSSEKSFMVTGFDGPDDPMNPKNMSVARKWLIVMTIALGSLCVTCTSSLYTITYGKNCCDSDSPCARADNWCRPDESRIWYLTAHCNTGSVVICFWSRDFAHGSRPAI